MWISNVAFLRHFAPSESQLTYENLKCNNISYDGTHCHDPAIITNGLGDGCNQFPSLQHNPAPEENGKHYINIVERWRLLHGKDDGKDGKDYSCQNVNLPRQRGSRELALNFRVKSPGHCRFLYHRSNHLLLLARGADRWFLSSA